MFIDSEKDSSYIFKANSKIQNIVNIILGPLNTLENGIQFLATLFWIVNWSVSLPQTLRTGDLGHSWCFGETHT